MGAGRLPRMSVVLRAAEEVPWTEIPAVRLLGLVLGGLLLIAAIRSMFGGKGK